LNERPLRILYVCGPGDVAGSWQHWWRGKDDPREVSVTYASQFFDLCERAGAQAKVVAASAEVGGVASPSMEIEHRPIPLQKAGGPLYHLGQISRMMRIAWWAWRQRSDVAVVSVGAHWWALALTRLLGTRVVVSLHRAFWPAGQRPSGVINRTMNRLNGWFWRRICDATLCISPECERQVRTIAGEPAGPIFQARAHYRRSVFETVPPPPGDRAPFRVLYAGRIEAGKGVFELVEVAARLAKRRPGQFFFELCGDGEALSQLRAAIDQQGLSDQVRLLGHLKQRELMRELGRSHAVVVPTNTDFAEGLNKVAIEAVLAGRPVVTSRLSHATDVLGSAAVEMPPGKAAAYVDALIRLSEDPAFYETTRHACLRAAEPFFDHQCSWGVVLEQALHQLGLRAEPTDPFTIAYQAAA